MNGGDRRAVIVSFPFKEKYPSDNRNVTVVLRNLEPNKIGSVNLYQTLPPEPVVGDMVAVYLRRRLGLLR